VECSIFATVLAGFTYSLVGLFQEPAAFTALIQESEKTPKLAGAALPSDMSSDTPPATGEAGRSPAAIAQPGDAMRAFDYHCDLTGEQLIVAGKVRITGPFCRGLGQSSSGTPLKTTLVNEANQFSATVFTDASTGRFSTDYVPLNVGSNPIQLEFHYANGGAVKKSFVLLKK
jgi:hypothetical protein